MAINPNWKDGEYGYCQGLVRSHGNPHVSREPSTVAFYLRLQAHSAFRDGEYEIAARLGAAAMAINRDACNPHTPDWDRAERYLDVIAAPVQAAFDSKACGHILTY